ncbi:hypothetical protein L2E82_20944 [Cichorium intybus]|uniref:Uncharacterized protein n=1 Tax=Cichorium intybus TaxID=13427 RepID=A0ACB9DV66_CICIN|nr:hypothetical protein L2E82_20944 [Cichorium intybus]
MVQLILSVSQEGEVFLFDGPPPYIPVSFSRFFFRPHFHRCGCKFMWAILEVLILKEIHQCLHLVLLQQSVDGRLGMELVSGYGSMKDVLTIARSGLNI